MSISPPSDIVLDVARAADPVKYKEAVARLNRLGAGAATDSFADVLDKASAPAKVAASKPVADPDAAFEAARAKAKSVAVARPEAARAYEGFEAMALATFVESMLPDDAETVFGTGSAGDIWKSMLAQQIAGEMAKSGGVGIARQLALSGASPLASAAKSTSPADIAADLVVTTTERSFLGGLDGENAGETSS